MATGWAADWARRQLNHGFGSRFGSLARNESRAKLEDEVIVFSGDSDLLYRINSLAADKNHFKWKAITASGSHLLSWLSPDKSLHI